jgi:hypothetical protein
MGVNYIGIFVDIYPRAILFSLSISGISIAIVMVRTLRWCDLMINIYIVLSYDLVSTR